MTTKCVVTAYAKDEAEAGKRRVMKYLRLRCKITFCTDCDAYHVLFSDDYALLDDLHRTVLERIAAGFRDVEIAAELSVTPKQVEHAVNRLSRRLNAMNRANLCVIAVALGIINPSAFIADVKAEE